METLYKYSKDNLQYEAVEKKVLKRFYNSNCIFRLFLILIAFLIIVFSSFIVYQQEKISQIKKQMLQEEMQYTMKLDSIQQELNLERIIAEYAINAHTEELTEENLENILELVNAWYPDIIIAQYKLESDHGKSDVAKNANNLFGMKKVSGKRLKYTTQELHVDYKGYGMYNNWQLSVIDRVMYERFFFSHKKPSKIFYMQMLLSYATDEYYFEKIKKFQQNNT